MSIIESQDTNGVKPLLQVGELGYDNYPVGGDKGRVYVGTGTENIALAKKTEVLVVDSKADNHIAKVNNPHSVTKAQVGLGNADNTADVNKNVLSATKLTTARTINGVSFDGTANIVAPTDLDIVAGTTAGPIVTSSTGTNATLPTASASASGVVTTGDQAWAGVKVFNSSPIVPTATTATQAVNKGQLDLKAPLESPTFTGTPKIGNDSIASISTAVTDNAIARFDGTTGKLQDSGVYIDDSNNVTVVNQTAAGLLMINTGMTNPIDATRLAQIAIGNTTSNTSARIAGYTDGNWSDGVSSPTSLRFYTTASGSNAVTERMRIDSYGNVLLTSGTGALGYGLGAGGAVTQLTSKSTTVTLNKPSGRIVMHNAALAAGASVDFTLLNSLIVTNAITAIVCLIGGVSNTRNYKVDLLSTSNGLTIRVTNISSGSLSEALVLHYTIIKGAVA